MLEHLFQSSKHLAQLRQAPFATAIDALADKFYRLGYAKRYSQRILWIVGKFNDYARALGIGTAAQVNESLMRHFVEDPAYGGTFVSVAMHHFQKHLRDQGIVPTAAARRLDDLCESILDNYDVHLINVRGLALSSRTQSLRYARRFLIWLQDRHGNNFLDSLNGVDVPIVDLDDAGQWPDATA